MHIEFRITTKKNLLVLFILILGLVSIAGCDAQVDDSKTIDNDEVSESLPLKDKLINHTMDYNDVPLSAEDQVLSLVGYGALGALQDDNLSILDMLIYAVEDEYLARGEYIAIMDEFDVLKPYSNIKESEETHLALLREIFQIYDLEFLTDLSDEHIIIPTSLLDAAQTGVQAEIDNIAMYEKFLTYDLPDNISQVFNALLRGSQSHLLAFEKQVERLR